MKNEKNNNYNRDLKNLIEININFINCQKENYFKIFIKTYIS